MKAIEIFKNIFSIIGIAAMIVAAYFIIKFVKGTNEKTNNNIDADGNLLDDILNNGGGTDNSISNTVGKLESNNNRLGDELSGARADNSKLEAISTELDKQNKQSRDNTTRLGKIRNELRDLLERIRSEGITKD